MFFNQNNPMKKYFVFIIAIMLLFGSCKNDKKIEEGSSQHSMTKKSVNPKNKTSGNKSAKVNNTMDENQLYNPCDIISMKELGEVLDVDESLINIKNVTNSGKYSSACSVIWENVENGSQNKMFFILQTNPLPEDIDDWARSFIKAKIENGDMGYPNNGKPYKYVPIDGFDDLVAYNDELKRVYWKSEGDYTIAIYYNAGFTESNRKYYAAKIAKIMNKNLKRKL